MLLTSSMIFLLLSMSNSDDVRPRAHLVLTLNEKFSSWNCLWKVSSFHLRHATRGKVLSTQSTAKWESFKSLFAFRWVSRTSLRSFANLRHTNVISRRRLSFHSISPLDSPMKNFSSCFPQIFQRLFHDNQKWGACREGEMMKTSLS